MTLPTIYELLEKDFDTNFVTEILMTSRHFLPSANFRPALQFSYSIATSLEYYTSSFIIRIRASIKQ